MISNRSCSFWNLRTYFDTATRNASLWPVLIFRVGKGDLYNHKSSCDRHSPILMGFEITGMTFNVILSLRLYWRKRALVHNLLTPTDKGVLSYSSCAGQQLLTLVAFAWVQLKFHHRRLRRPSHLVIEYLTDKQVTRNVKIYYDYGHLRHDNNSFSVGWKHISKTFSIVIKHLKWFVAQTTRCHNFQKHSEAIK